MRKITLIVGMALCTYLVQAQYTCPRNAKEDKEHIMSEAYWKLWNPSVQAKIDKDIEANRKSDATIEILNIPENASVEIKQISSDFFFGSHIFNFNQLGSHELNEKYKEVFGTLFNRATVPFYRRTFELEEGKPRYEGGFEDSEEFWNQQGDPMSLAHWRRPAPDPIVKYLLNKGVVVHGHVMVYGACFGMPLWLPKLLTPDEKKEMDKLVKKYPCIEDINSKTQYTDVYKNISEEELEKKFPIYGSKLKNLINNQVKDLALHYGSKVSSWDVVNETSEEFRNGYLHPGTNVCKCSREIMPGDFTYDNFKVAEKYLPENVWMNINDGDEKGYYDEIKSLISRGAKIDIIGIQRHIWTAQNSIDISNGTQIQSPEQTYETMNRYASLNRPLCVSEITIVAPTQDHKGEMIQAIIARNLYRIWFSIENMKAITWWNIVDGCGYQGESLTSGLFTRNMKPKMSFYALNSLINGEWKTNLTVKADKNGNIKFRGFKGKYLISWTDKSGNKQITEYHLK